jgi:uncharacterized membrane protein YphA (DoxX/SURF4 family)
VSFPRGSSGLGLMLLRITASGLLVAIACHNLSRGDAGLISVVFVVLAIFLTLGLFTILVSSVAASLTLVFFIFLHQETLSASVATSAVCIALALLGAGAYSVDARLFGQRRVVWPNQ